MKKYEINSILLLQFISSCCVKISITICVLQSGMLFFLITRKLYVVVFVIMFGKYMQLIRGIYK